MSFHQASCKNLNLIGNWMKIMDGTSPTVSSNPSTGETQSFNQSAVEKCQKFIEDFQKGLIQMGDTLLEIEKVLQAAIVESDILTQLEFKPGFNHYLELLDRAHESRESHDTQRSATFEEQQSITMNSNLKLPMIWGLKRRSSEQSYESEFNLKKRKVVNSGMIMNMSFMEKTLSYL
ncbi:hypothetical protein BDR07DRAFT_1378338 [Suillus spraguei]|nr:hypothetical protein BDR07DRAFT_1378338 [Suillus spraguei]